MSEVAADEFVFKSGKRLYVVPFGRILGPNCSGQDHAILKEIMNERGMTLYQSDKNTVGKNIRWKNAVSVEDYHKLVLASSQVNI